MNSAFGVERRVAPRVEAITGGQEAAQSQGAADGQVAWSAGNARLSSISLFAADLVAGLLTYVAILAARALIWEDVSPIHWAFWSSGLVWFLLRWSSELYKPFGMYPPEALQRSFQTAAVAFLLHLAILIDRQELHPWRLFALSAWVILPVATYTLRSIVCSFLAGRGCYGVPLVVVGNRTIVLRAIRELMARPDNGYVPIGVFLSDGRRAGDEKRLGTVPVLGQLHQAAHYPFAFPIMHALIASDQPALHAAMTFPLSRRFRHLQAMDGALGTSSWLARARPIGPYVSIETRHARFSPAQMIAKRSLDIAISLPVLVLAAPIILACGLFIAARDPGPMFFSQIREGKAGRPIRIYKLRSMVLGAESKLAAYLAFDDAARFEYERTMKLRRDPRIIPGIGNFVRKTSIDEIPQLWSILRGDMSLVGPRVMPTREIDLYSETAQEVRRDILPGLTGFWQVEHRNNSDFEIREIADSFYVHNWTIWLDLWIILRTFRVVFSGAGAV